MCCGLYGRFRVKLRWILSYHNVCAAPLQAYTPGLLPRSSSLAPSRRDLAQRRGAVLGLRATLQSEIQLQRSVAVGSPAAATVWGEKAETKNALLKLGLRSCRGERASTKDLAELEQLVMDLVENSSADDMRLHSAEGVWDLVMCSSQLFRRWLNLLSPVVFL